MIWANLLHLSFNMWEEHDSPTDRFRKERRTLWFDEPLWDELLQRMVDAGMNMVVLDLGDGVRYESHPEIAVKNAWSTSRLREETQRLREMGLELIPKLNFSTCHDAWLGIYSRMVSTPTYYTVCRELIDEVITLTQPRLMHLGMDEETAAHQSEFNMVIVRQNELYWHDMLYLLDTVRQRGVQPWIWSDIIWNKPDEFLKRMPKDVMQSNWYYGNEFATGTKHTQAYLTLEEHAFPQIPTCSNWTKPENTQMTVDYCRQHIAPERLHGFLEAPWRPTVAEYRDKHIQTVDLMAQARAKY